MKFVHFLYVFVFIILNCINTFANLNGYDLILNRIKNDTLLCINPEIYDHKQFENCMKPVPVDVKDGSPLDVLCMSVYDSFLLLCEGNKNEKLKEKIPQDLKQFGSVLDSQSNQTLDTFCTTIKENKNLKTRLKSSNITNQWINLFIDSMKEEKSCLRICSNADGTVVEPLCPFVVWTNQLYSENSNPTVVPSNPAVVPRNPAIVPSNPAVVPRNPAIVPSNPAVVSSNPPAVPQQSSASKSVYEYTNIDTPDTSRADKGNANSNGTNPKPEPKPGKGESEGDEVSPPVNKVVETPHQKVVNADSNLVSPGENDETPKQPKMEQEGGHEVQKKKQDATDGNNGIGETQVVEVATIKVTDENGQAIKSKEITTGELEQNKDTENKVEVSLPSTVSGDSTNVGAPSKANAFSDDNDKGINEDGIVLSNEEENNENGRDFVVDGNGGADGLEHEEDSDDDIQIPSDVKETLPVAPVQNKQPTFNAAHAGINAETDMEQVIVRDDPFVEAEESHFFTYFISMAVLSIVMYLVFHNKKKLVALAVEGRRTRSTTRRRPNTASYSKLDCNLEEAMVSNTTASVTHVLY